MNGELQLQQNLKRQQEEAELWIMQQSPPAEDGGRSAGSMPHLRPPNVAGGRSLSVTTTGRDDAGQFFNRSPSGDQ
ncbi:hypothetical protein HK101_001834, partial [Irineochytrium annulatum]